MRYVLELAYNGTAYHGWQSQKNSTTVQEVVEATLSRIYNEKMTVYGCGRTDSGVHASRYILHFESFVEQPHRFLFRLNQMLPPDVVIYEVFEVIDNFHSRFSAKYRKYVYKTTFVKNPFAQDGVYFLYQTPDLDLMNKACEELMTHKDFKAFSKASEVKTTICDLMEARWIDVDGQLEFHVQANRFLRNMVRALVGTLLDVGYGNMTLEELRVVIESKDRNRSGKSVPAKGLYLAEVGYNWDEFRK